MAIQICSTKFVSIFNKNSVKNYPPSIGIGIGIDISIRKYSITCSIEKEEESKQRIILRTCKLCKTQFDPCLNHPQACRFHSAHFGGETKRKFESVYTGGTMNTPDSGKVFQYWHCCGSEDPFHPGCTASPHSSYDD